MERNKKAIVLTSLFGILICFIIFLLIKRHYLFSVLLAAAFVIGLSFAGRLSAPFYFERAILNLLKSRSGQIERDRIIEHFIRSAPSIEEADIESTVASALRKLEKKGSVNTDNEGDIIKIVE